MQSFEAMLISGARAPGGLGVHRSTEAGSSRGANVWQPQERADDCRHTASHRAAGLESPGRPMLRRSRWSAPVISFGSAGNS